jgi:hypothetical protein
LTIGQSDRVMKKVVFLAENIGGLVVVGRLDHFL